MFLGVSAWIHIYMIHRPSLSLTMNKAMNYFPDLYVNNKMDVRVLSIISPSCIYYIAMKMSSWKIAYSTSLDLFFILVKYVETIKLETYPMDAIKTWLIKIEVIPRLFVTTVLHIPTQSLLFIIVFFLGNTWNRWWKNATFQKKFFFYL